MKRPQILVLSLLTSGIAGAFSSNPPNIGPSPLQNSFQRKTEIQSNQKTSKKVIPPMTTPKNNKKNTNPARSVESEYLISFEAHVTDEERKELFEKVGVQEIEKVGSSPLYLILIVGDSSEAKIKALQESKGVRYVEANFSFQILKKSDET